MADLDESRDATPESAGITGGVPAAAEAPPQTRGRLGSEHASTYILIVLAILLLLTAAIADQGSKDAIGMVILAVALIGIAVMSITAFLGPVAVALLGFAAGVLSTVLAFSAGDFGAPQLVLPGLRRGDLHRFVRLTGGDGAARIRRRGALGRRRERLSPRYAYSFTAG